MNRKIAGAARALISLSVFALLSVAVISAEAGNRHVARPAAAPRIDSRGAPLLVRLVGLAPQARARRSAKRHRGARLASPAPESLLR